MQDIIGYAVYNRMLREETELIARLKRQGVIK